MAEAANQKGSALYNAGKYDEAREFFMEASKLDAIEPKYPSNLSAVLYELAYYPECIMPLYIAWGRLMAQNAIDGVPSTPPESNPLTIKLATRLAKASIYGVASNLVSLHRVKPEEKYANTHEDIIKFVASKRENSTDPKLQDLNSVWTQWEALQEKCAQHSEAECDLVNSEAQKRLRALQIFKTSFDSSMEYFKFGHDTIQSLLLGLNGKPEDPHSLEFNIERENWAFLFGGSGDARHVFGTLIHIAGTAKVSSTLRKTDAFSVHMTLIDIHPATLARVLVVFSLIHQILRVRLTKNHTKKVEIHATLLYLYTTMFMPVYCRQIVMETCAELVTSITSGSSSLLKCLHINEKSIPAILDYLKYWSTPLPKSTQILIERNQQNANQIFTGPDSDASHCKSLRDNLLTSKSKGPYNDPDVELKIYRRTKILLPPKSLLSHHPALATLVKSYSSASNAQYMAVLTEVKNTWYPNPTLFDKFSESPESAVNGSYPNVANDPFQTLATLADMIGDFQSEQPVVSSSGNSGFVAASGFFEMVADAVWDLQNKLKIEMIVGDVITGPAKLFSGELGERPKGFPTTYTRMFLSNVPDYTHGVLNTAVHLSHYLEPEELVIANCLTNTGVFRNISAFCYNYTLLRPEDMPRYLGCEILNPDRLAFDDIALLAIPLPRPLDELASKKELHRWLGHLLLCTLCNGTPRPQPMWIDLPNNINAFLHVLVHLHRVGFPSHWISEFLQSMISNTMVTTAQPYLGTTPIPSSEAINRIPATKVHLEAWQAEFQVMVASTLPALPFYLTLPPDYPTYNDIRTFKATVRPFKPETHPQAFRWGSLIYSGRSKTAGLLFFKPAPGVDAESIARLIPGLLTGVKEMRDIQVQIMLCAESIDLDDKKEISWKMSQAWYDRMKEEKWRMAAYRTDIYIPGTVSVSVDEWSKIS